MMAAPSLPPRLRLQQRQEKEMKHRGDDYSEPSCSKSCSCAGQPEAVRSLEGKSEHLVQVFCLQ